MDDLLVDEDHDDRLDPEGDAEQADDRRGGERDPRPQCAQQSIARNREEARRRRHRRSGEQQSDRDLVRLGGEVAGDRGLGQLRQARLQRDDGDRGQHAEGLDREAVRRRVAADPSR